MPLTLVEMAETLKYGQVTKTNIWVKDWVPEHVQEADGIWPAGVIPAGWVTRECRYLYVHRYYIKGKSYVRTTTVWDKGERWLSGFMGRVVYKSKELELPCPTGS